MNVTATCEGTAITKEANLIKCPHCGQKLTDALLVMGKAVLRVKCRRCKWYIRIVLTS